MLDAPIKWSPLRRRFPMWNEDTTRNTPELVISTGSESAAAVNKLLADVGIVAEPAKSCEGSPFDVLICAIDDQMADLMMAKRKKDVETDEDLDDEEEEDDLDEEEDEDDFEDEEDDDDEFEEEFGDDDLDDDDDDIFYDDEDDE